MTTSRALILDPGGSRGALAACRSLHRAGWTVGVASPKRSLAARSRSTSAVHAVAPAIDDEDRFVGGVADAVTRGGYDVVLPAGDAEALALSRHRAGIGAVVPYADHEVVALSFDKRRVAEVADRCGIAVPREQRAFPAIVKPASHAGVGDGGARVEGVVVHEQATLDRAVQRIIDAGGDALVQEMIDGTLEAIAVVVDRAGDIRARVQQRAARVWPVSAGVSARAETIDPDPELCASVDALLRELGWFGLMQLQFLVPVDGVPRLIDCNGRLYGSLALAVSAGCDLAAVWANVALDRPQPYVEGRSGHHYQWLEGDLRRAVEERRDGLARDVSRTLAHGARANHSLIDWRDPMPALAQVAELGRRAARKLGGRR